MSTTSTRAVGLLLVLSMVGAIGCYVPELPEEEPEEEPPQKVLNETTQEIGRYDPAEGREVSDTKIHATNPVTGPLEAYGPMVAKSSILSVEYQVNLYNAEHGRFPTYEEFMEEIIKRHNVHLPVLPGGQEYQYDEENHRLVVVEPEEE